MRQFLLYIVLGLGLSSSLAQKSIKIGANYSKKPLVFDSLYDDTYSISTMRFYVSDIVITDLNHKVIYTHPTKHILIDLSRPTSQYINFDDTSLCTYAHLRIQFSVGIDSTTNSQGAMSGDLDPVNGMYWTWQSGYINLKIEGTKKADTVDQEFQFHIGGYRAPYSAFGTINTPLLSEINFELDEILNRISWEQDHIMSPSKAAMNFMAHFTSNSVSH